MNAPEEFVERLEREFGQKYRVRWSDARNEWHVEQKIRRGIAEGFANVALKNTQQRRNREDDLIRARDGYVLTMSVNAGNHTYCHECNTKMSVPSFETAVIFCPFCRLKGRQRHQVAGYFPLGDSLIDHLRKIDSERGGTDRVVAEVDRSNQWMLAQNERKFRNHIEAGVKDRFNRLVGIQQTGYTGRIFKGHA